MVAVAPTLRRYELRRRSWHRSVPALAQLMGARLMGARLMGARLMGARLMGTRLMGTRLMGTRLKGARLMEKLNALRLAAVAAQGGHWLVGGARSEVRGARSEAEDPAGAREGLDPVETTRLGAAAVKCPSRASLGRATAPRDRPTLRRELRPFLEPRNWATVVSAAVAAPAVAHWLRVECPTSQSRRSTDGWLSGRVVAAPRHSFDIDLSIARPDPASSGTL